MMHSNAQEKQHFTVIKSGKSILDINLKELWSYRDLIFLLIRRDFVSVYKQTLLGPLWFCLNPLFSMLVYSFIFGKIAGIPTEGAPPFLFYLSGIIVWNYFTSCFIKTSDTFIANSAIFSKVYFPRIVVPISIVITNLVTFFIQFVLFILFLIYYLMEGTSVHPNLWVLATPLIILNIAILGLGFGIVVSSLLTKYRDLSYLLSFGIQLWMYATPVIYPLSAVPENWRWIVLINPVTACVEFFRQAFLGGSSIFLWHLGLSVGIAIIVLVCGMILFSKIERTFVDTI